uniref:Immunoglobulin V-set domain-containing protein n=1 Tax=Bubo bubo TaxID=30461 RepID=A0A8C0IA83_BUBBB
MLCPWAGHSAHGALQPILPRPGFRMAAQGPGPTCLGEVLVPRLSSYIMFWYQQGPRSSLDWIYREGDAYGEGLQGGFKGTVLSSQNRCTLQLQAAKQGDEAVYYCGNKSITTFP